ncbi:MAG: flavodoxin domain-containing protein [Glaciecola sp.]|jgi:flavodoxin
MAKIGIIVGSVYGNAQNVADHADIYLSEQGHDVTVETDPDLGFLDEHDIQFVITSTTGMGDVPPNLELFFADAKDTMPMQTGKKFAVAALGDSSYCESYCGAGKQFFELFTELQAQPLLPLLEVDAMETFEPEKDVLLWLQANIEKFAA